MQASTTRQLPQPGAFGHYTRCSRIPPLCAQAPGASAAAALLPAPPALAAAELEAPQSEQVDSSLSGFSMLQPTYESVHLPATYDAQQAADAAMQAANAAAETLSNVAGAAVAPLDVFKGAWGLDMLFWGVLLGLSFTLIALNPRP